jgi:hypothetical protein
VSHTDETRTTPGAAGASPVGSSPDDVGGADLRERSFGELAKSLSEDISTLVRQELALARAEMTEKGKRAGIGIGMFGAAGVIGLGAFGALTAFFILALAEAGLDGWLAALIVTLVYAAIAGVLAMQGREKVSEATPAVPEQTKETIKEDIQWAKTQIGSDKRS